MPPRSTPCGPTRTCAHGLIQAYSRTNRILNSVKTYGNIVSFRNLEQETNDALALFGNKDAKGIVLLKPYADYYTEYGEKVAGTGRAVSARRADRRRGRAKGVHRLFGHILRLKNILTAFDDFAGHEILTEREFQDYRASTSTCMPIPERIGCREGIDQRRCCLRDRADQAGRDQRRLHPDAWSRST